MSITTGLELIDPEFYGDNGPPHEYWTRLRAESPVHWCDIPDMDIEPFWAITFTAALDRQLNERGFILPGLGDAGDHLFGTR